MAKRFESLDAFRGIAALCVVIFHMRWVGSITELDFFRGSSLFVEFFFVLSGFVLAHGYMAKENVNILNLMKLRFFRLYPLHVFMFVMFIVLEIGKLVSYKYGGFSFNNIPFSEKSDISEMVPNLLLIHSWSPMFEPLSFNYPSWSISIEFYTYLLFFISLVFFKKLNFLSWFLISLFSSVLIVFDSVLLTGFALKGLSCFFGGAFVYFVYTRVQVFRVSKLIGSLLEFFLLVSVVMVVQSDMRYQSTIATLIFYFTILFFAFESGVVSDFLKSSPFQLLGKLSYSIYMTHGVILLYLTSVFLVFQKYFDIELAPTFDGVRYLTSGNEFINDFMVFLVLGLVLMLSNLTHKYIELMWLKKSKAKN